MKKLFIGIAILSCLLCCKNPKECEDQYWIDHMDIYNTPSNAHLDDVISSFQSIFENDTLFKTIGMAYIDTLVILSDEIHDGKSRENIALTLGALYWDINYTLYCGQNLKALDSFWLLEGLTMDSDLNPKIEPDNIVNTSTGKDSIEKCKS